MDDYLLCERLKEIAEAIKAQNIIENNRNEILADQREELSRILGAMADIRGELENFSECGMSVNVQV